jgi:hypothetical protein
VVYKVRKVLQVWVGRDGVVGGVVVKAEGVGGGVLLGGEVSGGARVWAHSATSVTEEVCVASPSEVYRRVGTQPAWSWGPVGSRLPSPGAKRRDGPTSMTRIDQGQGR